MQPTIGARHRRRSCLAGFRTPFGTVDARQGSNSSRRHADCQAIALVRLAVRHRAGLSLTNSRPGQDDSSRRCKTLADRSCRFTGGSQRANGIGAARWPRGNRRPHTLRNLLGSILPWG